MSWIYFPLFFYPILILWLIAIFLLFKKNNARLSVSLTTIGVILLLLFVSLLWISLGRPPMRTLGETRLWYSLFLPIIGLVTFNKWKYRWFLQYALGMSILFLVINYLKPETHEKTLMPALQSVWFVPHVIVYMFAYAMLAASSLVSVYGLYSIYKNKEESNDISLADNLVFIGFSFLTLGLLFGALWAKEAWGDYWTWDPKETWALISWLGYLLYIHIRYHQNKNTKLALLVLSVSFVLLLICWFGLNYLPTAQNSVHTYTQ